MCGCFTLFTEGTCPHKEGITGKLRRVKGYSIELGTVCIRITVLCRGETGTGYIDNICRQFIHILHKGLVKEYRFACLFSILGIFEEVVEGFLTITHCFGEGIVCTKNLTGNDVVTMVNKCQPSACITSAVDAALNHRLINNSEFLEVNYKVRKTCCFVSTPVGSLRLAIPTFHQSLTGGVGIFQHGEKVLRCEVYTCSKLRKMYRKV